MNLDDEPLFPEAYLIHAYIRDDALADGALIDLPEAQTMGFTLPMTITAAAHEECIAWPQQGPRQEHIVSLRVEGVFLAMSMAARTHLRHARAYAEPTTDHLVFGVNTVAWRQGHRVRDRAASLGHRAAGSPASRGDTHVARCGLGHWPVTIVPS